jgi:hypothetical protein
VSDIVTRLREACAEVVGAARSVRLDAEAIPAYAASLPLDAPVPQHPQAHLRDGDPETVAAFWLTLDAINFGSGWFPTLRKRPGVSGYFTIAGGLRERFATDGAWSALQLVELSPGALARLFGQDEEHPLMALFAHSLRDLGAHLQVEHDGRFLGPVQAADGSAVALAEHLGAWASFADESRYGRLCLPFLKRAQIAAADLQSAGVVRFGDLHRLTMFADNLVPHVLRLDGVLEFAPELAARIARGELIEHGSPEEVEIRACALHAVELIAAARPASWPAQVDVCLWERGQGPRYKARPRHRSRCTAY